MSVWHVADVFKIFGSHLGKSDQVNQLLASIDITETDRERFPFCHETVSLTRSHRRAIVESGFEINASSA